MKKRLVMATFFSAVLLGSAGISYAAFSQKEPLREQISKTGIGQRLQGVYRDSLEYSDEAGDFLVNASYRVKHTVQYNWTLMSAWSQSLPSRINAQLASFDPSRGEVIVPIEDERVTLSDLQARKAEWDRATRLDEISPASGESSPPDMPSRWKADQDSLEVEAVLVPRQVMVVSSSQDGRIKDVLVGQGDRFKKGDVLIEYDCADLEAEAAIAGMEKRLTSKKSAGGQELFKLDIISDIDRLGVEIEDRQASSRVRLYEARLDHCRIRAQFDGRVTNRLANPGEYTRTDRVLMEVASDEPLHVEFMVPSKWLRWVNTGAPIKVVVNETEATYEARIARIYGEVDPVSQSIQMVGMLENYKDALLPGMSGQVKLSIREIEEAGVRGFLQVPVEQ